MAPTIKKHKLTFPLKNVRGTNLQGKRVARFRGWRSKNINYAIDYQRSELKFVGLVLSIFKIMHKTSFIAFIRYTNGSFSYIIASHGMEIGQVITSFTTFNYTRTTKQFLLPGSMIPIRLLSRYAIFANLRARNSKQAKYARAAGTYCQLIEKFEDYQLAIIKLPTGLSKIASLDAYVTVGRNSNIMNKFTVFGKAGIRRKSGHKPIVRGVARNPVDHPNGGRTKTNKPEKSL